MADGNGSQNNAHTHSIQPEYKKAYLGPDNRRLAMLYEEYGQEFLEEFRNSQRKRV